MKILSILLVFQSASSLSDNFTMDSMSNDDPSHIQPHNLRIRTYIQK